MPAIMTNCLSITAVTQMLQRTPPVLMTSSRVFVSGLPLFIHYAFVVMHVRLDDALVIIEGRRACTDDGGCSRGPSTLGYS